MDLSPPSFKPTVRRVSGPSFSSQDVHHRFLPGEKPRQTVEPARKSAATLAGEVNFKPVITLRLAGNNVFVRPVTNIRPRPVSHEVVATPRIDVPHQTAVDISPQLHEQIKTQAQVATKAVLPTPPLPEIKSQASPAEIDYNKAVKEQLDQINKLLFEQIKQKVAQEIAKQRKEGKLPPGPPPIKELKPSQTPAVVQPKPLTEAPKPIVAIQTAPPPPLTQPAPVVVPNKPVIQSEEKPPQPVFPTKSAQEPVRVERASFSQEVRHLEQEIHSLNKEILELERMIHLKLAEKETQPGNLEVRLNEDEKALHAVVGWRETLNNLVDSHSKAIKYLKQKEDWLEYKERKLTHPEKHYKVHHKPKSVPVDFPQIGQELTQKTPEIKGLEVKPPLPVAKPTPVVPIVKTPPTQPSLAPTTNQPASKIEEKPKVPLTPTIKVPTPPSELKAKPLETPSTLGPQTGVKSSGKVPITTTPQTNLPPASKPPVSASTNLKEVQTPTFEAVKEMVHQAIEKEEPNLKPSQESVSNLVEESLKTKEITGKATPESVKEVVQEVLKEHEEAAKPTPEEIKTLVREELEKQMAQAVPAGTGNKADLEGMVKDIVAENAPKTQPTQVVVNLSKEGAAPSTPGAQPVVGIPVSLNINQADIEKQILETAEKEEEAKEAVQEAEYKKKEESQKQIEAQQKPPLTTPTIPVSISAENLKVSLDKLKTNLTTLGNTPAKALTQQQRETMLKDLQNLENEAQVTKQLDELKASQERRKINAEIQKMLGAFQTPSAPVPTQTDQPVQSASKGPSEKIESLKVEEKRKTTPEEKARIIVEIKELERESQARKAVEMARPAVKAQPAFGRLLPNTPTIPNVINGLVKDSRGLLLPTVVIIVKDKNGDPVRALKTNKLGQFALSTPVPNGTYRLELEKEGYDFDIIEVDVDGTIMKPIEIRGR